MCLLHLKAHVTGKVVQFSVAGVVHFYIAADNTPEQVFTGSYQQIARIKQAALNTRYAQNPERFVKCKPVVKLPPNEVAINPISAEDIAEGVIDAVNFPTLHAAG